MIFLYLLNRVYVLDNSKCYNNKCNNKQYMNDSCEMKHKIPDRPYNNENGTDSIK